VKTPYGFGKDLSAKTLDDAVAQVTAALAQEGFGVLTTIDVQATLKKKLDVDFRPYTILGACNPKLAHQGLSADPELGLLLPCNVVVQGRDDGGFRVSFLDPQKMFTFVNVPGVEDVASEAETRLRRVLAALA
jgi:uncharacterized protein (DUF302 family)